MIRCLLVSGIFPPDIGGPARFVPAMSNALQERGFECSVLTLGEPSRSASFSFPVHYVSRAHRVPVRMALTVKALRRLSRNVDVILANGLHVEAAAAARLSGRPLVTKVVGDEVWDRASRLGWTRDSLDDFQSSAPSIPIRALKSLRRRALSVSETIIVPSQYTANLVRGWVSHGPRVVVIPNAVEPTPVRTPYLLKQEIRPLHKIVFVGRLISLKRVDALLSVVATLPDVALVVVGEGDQRTALVKTAAELGIASRVQFTGAVDQQSVWSVLTQSSLLVLNSATENCPHVVLEAMAMGLPVVATRVGGIPEIVEDRVTGLLVDPGESDELRTAILNILADDDLRRRLGTAAKASMSRFSWRSTADAVASVLHESCTS